jgi:hypothetical protein
LRFALILGLAENRAGAWGATQPATMMASHRHGSIIQSENPRPGISNRDEGYFFAG